jgi:hypothetical protein
MFSKLFNRSKATSAATPPPTAPVPATPSAVSPKESRLDVFREEWDARRETSQDVVEGNGGNTEWQAFTEMVEYDEKTFPPTVPMPLNPE